jgi:hypothetical protein
MFFYGLMLDNKPGRRWRLKDPPTRRESRRFGDQVGSTNLTLSRQAKEGLRIDRTQNGSGGCPRKHPSNVDSNCSVTRSEALNPQNRVVTSSGGTAGCIVNVIFRL